MAAIPVINEKGVISMTLYPNEWGHWISPEKRERVIVFVNGKRRKMWRRKAV